MKIDFISCAVALLSLTASCQSARMATHLPAVQPSAYHHAGSRPAEPDLTLVAVAGEGNLINPTSTPRLVRPAPQPHTTPVTPSPDTAVKAKTGRAKVALAGKADPFTTAVNITGGVNAGVGLMMMAHSTTIPSHDRSRRLGRASTATTGLLMLMFGVALLLFQGANGRKRLAREAANSGSQVGAASASPVASPTRADIEAQQRRNRMLGIRMMLWGGTVSVLLYVLALTQGIPLELVQGIIHFAALPVVLSGVAVLLSAQSLEE